MMTRSGKGGFLLLLCAALPMGAAAAQEASTSVEQMPASEDSPIDQIAAPSPDESPADKAVAPAPQIATGGESRRVAPQLTRERRSAPATAQLSAGAPSAESSQPLSSLAEGRTADAQPVEGDDRCDPAQEESRRPVCERVVEARADEFNAPRPAQLSPEQRLLLEQQRDEDSNSAAGAARRLAATGTADDSIESLGVAAIALRNGLEQPTEEPPPEQAVPGQDLGGAVVTAIINQMGGTPPQ